MMAKREAHHRAMSSTGGRYTLDASMLGSRFYALCGILCPHHRLEVETAWPTVYRFYMEYRTLTAHCGQLAGERLLERARHHFLKSSFHRVSIAGLQVSLCLLSLWSAIAPLCTGESFGGACHTRFLSYLGAGMA